MQTICVIHGLQGGGSSQVLGAIVAEANIVKGAVQQYQKAVGPLNNRAAFNDFVRSNKFQLASCVPIDVDQI
jgi:hypothetical protein